MYLAVAYMTTCSMVMQPHRNSCMDFLHNKCVVFCLVVTDSAVIILSHDSQGLCNMSLALGNALSNGWNRTLIG
jgi:hypothetical protein